MDWHGMAWVHVPHLAHAGGRHDGHLGPQRLVAVRLIHLGLCVRCDLQLVGWVLIGWLVG